MLVADAAAACPVCAQRTDGGPMRWVSLALFIALPFLVVGTAIWYLRRQARGATEGQELAVDGAPTSAFGSEANK